MGTSDRRWKPSRFIYKGSHGLVSFSPDSKYLITAMQENEIHAWRLRDKDNLKCLVTLLRLKALIGLEIPYL